VRTKEIIEGLLYITPYKDILTKCLTTCHILNESDRSWKATHHPEFHFLDDFKYCSFLMIIDKQLHVYLIGEKSKNRSYHILNIEGHTTELLNLPKSLLIEYIETQSKETDKLYLPELFGKRIIFIKPDYVNGLLGEEDVYVFNNQSLEGNLFRKTNWSIGTDVYKVDQPSFRLSAKKILQECLKEIV